MENLTESLNNLKSLITEMVDETKMKVLRFGGDIQFKKTLPKDLNGFKFLESKEGNGVFYVLYSFGDKYIIFEIKNNIELVSDKFETRLEVHPMNHQPQFDEMDENGVTFDSQIINNLYQMPL